MQALYSDKFIAAFWSKVDRSDPVGCWPWKASTDKDGYGKISLRINGKRVHLRAHRVALELTSGPIENGLWALHSNECNRAGCCNPSHLRRGDVVANTEDKVKCGNQPRHESHGRAKLTDEEVRIIRETAALVEGHGGKQLRPRGWAQKIAIELNVSTSLIHQIVSRSIWR